MKHRVAGRRLGRVSAHRDAMMRNLVTSLLEHERIVTTLPKAKELRPVAEKMITLGKRETLHARRQALAVIRKKTVVHKLFETLAPRFADRQGGYTRILRLGIREGDAAELALIEFVSPTPEAAPAEKKPARKAKSKAEPKPAEAKAKSKAKKKTARTARSAKG